MSVDYNVLEKFLDIDELELNYHRVTSDINSIDIEDLGKLIIDKVYEKFQIVLEWEIKIIGELKK